MPPTYYCILFCDASEIFNNVLVEVVGFVRWNRSDVEGDVIRYEVKKGREAAYIKNWIVEIGFREYVRRSISRNTTMYLKN